MQTVRDLAKAALKSYVERGDTVAQICEGGMGHGSTLYSWQIGGIVWTEEGRRKTIGPHTIVVTTFNGCNCLVLFSVPVLVQEIKHELAHRDDPTQQSLL